MSGNVRFVDFKKKKHKSTKVDNQIQYSKEINNSFKKLTEKRNSISNKLVNNQLQKEILRFNNDKIKMSSEFEDEFNEIKRKFDLLQKIRSDQLK